jgi:hypothetical protein
MMHYEFLQIREALGFKWTFNSPTRGKNMHWWDQMRNSAKQTPRLFRLSVQQTCLG